MSGGGGGGGDQVVGYRYYFGIHMGICRGRPNELVCIRVGDKGVWAGHIADNTSFPINAPEVFGGEDGEGGIQGTAIAMFGEPSQTCPSEIVNMHGRAQPGFRGVFTLFYDGLVSMMNPYPKSWKMRVRHTDSGRPWNQSMATIVMNGATDQTGSVGDIVLTGQMRNRTPFGHLAVFTPQTSVSTSFGTFSLTEDGNYTYILNRSNLAVAALSPGQKIHEVMRCDWTYSGGHSTTTGHYDLDVWINGSWADPVLTVGDTYVSAGPNMYGPGDIHAMNPAHILYYCFTDKEQGRGLDPNVFLDMTSFGNAAAQLYGEGFGLCLKWSKSDSLSNFISMVIDHIGAVIYTNRTTGKITLKLIRGDYNVEDLPLFTPETGLIEITENAIANSGSLINEVRVTYHHAVFDEDRTVRTHNLAGIQSSGGTVNSASRSYKGIPTPELALRVAQRDLKALGSNLRKVTFYLDRRGRNVYPGDVIRISHPSMKVKEMIVRVGKVEDAGITDGKIKCTGVQDVFGLPDKAFSVPVSNTWTAPTNRPCYGAQDVFELPYFLIARRASAADLAYFDINSAGFGAVCDKGSPLNGSYTVAVRNSASDGTDVPPDNSYACTGS